MVVVSVVEPSSFVVVSTFLFPTLVVPASGSLVTSSVTTSSLPGSDTVVISFSPSTGALSTTFSSKFKLSSASYFTSALIVSVVTLVVLAISSIGTNGCSFAFFESVPFSFSSSSDTPSLSSSRSVTSGSPSLSVSL